MQVSDLVNQYQNIVGAGTRIQTKTKGVEQLANTVSAMEKGQVFEGSVKSIKGDTVLLSLSNGQNITAKLDKGMNLTQGQSLFFQVKSNEGGVVAIKPFDSQVAGNLTLLNALKSAGLPQNEKNLNMVDAMMKEQLPIDKASIKDMSNLVKAYPNANLETLASLKKLDLPINQATITQYENYKESEGAVLKTVNELSDRIPTLLSSEGVTKEDATTFIRDFLNVVGDKEELNQGPLSLKSEAGIVGTLAADTAADTADTNTQNPGAVNPTEDKTSVAQTPAGASANTTIPIEYEKEEMPMHSIGKDLPKDQVIKLDSLLKEIPGLKDSIPGLFDENDNIKPQLKPERILKEINDFISNNPNITKEEAVKILGHESVKSLVSATMEKAWTIEPKDLTKKNAIDDLYKKIDEDMEKIINTSKNISKSDNNPVASSAQSIKDNLSFVREVNQLYSYIQIPLQMSGERTTGDLYVYANKKHKKSENDELTAFLHFDMDNLGPTDISVKMLGKKVDTKFYLDDDISYQLVEKYLPQLEEKLKDLGYSVSLSVENDSKKVNFVEDFLKQDQKTAGNIHRYSFDMRA